ncbi:hypothetical protein NLG97_g6847 [Lecanicillium saksenae]|uniref:Uncharacterized protein n=1 Tax=Lecanicillium saksenae TaxID=468837 RepID=A0ACC1QR20_9HYPO|nr:hypothetical protein NLG97_g6847 [Lecanicillium saksenae]
MSRHHPYVVSIPRFSLAPCLCFACKIFANPSCLPRSSDLVMCRKQPGIAIGRLCDKCDGKCPVCDSYVRPTTLVRICDECSFGNYQNKCVVCGGEGISDAFYCFECTRLEKDRDGCPKIINLGSSRTDVRWNLSFGTLPLRTLALDVRFANPTSLYSYSTRKKQIGSRITNHGAGQVGARFVAYYRRPSNKTNTILHVWIFAWAGVDGVWVKNTTAAIVDN